MNSDWHLLRLARIAGLVVAVMSLSGCATQALTPPAPGDLRGAGQVEFGTTCAPAVEAEFNRGLAMLHSFFYEEARRIFTAVTERDPQCAMAHWGVAMTWWHPIWAPPAPDEMSAGSDAAERASGLKASPRERGFIDAIRAYYGVTEAGDGAPVGQSCHGPVGPKERVVAYLKAMRALQENFPQDLETQVFHAFAVLALGYATPTDTALTHQRAAGQQLEALWATHRRHPGVAHYLIHSYDYPPLAARALPAAQSYAALAPWVPHALHMPSHIFTRLGMWDESVATNQASAEASRAYAASRGRAVTEAEELHALDYMMYSYLQEGRDAEAQQVLAQVGAARPGELEFASAYALAAVPARYALERNAWREAAELPVPARPHWSKFPFTEALLEYAHALGRARTGDAVGARQAVERMRVLREAIDPVRYDYFRRHVDLQLQAASAWLAQAEGRSDEAVAILTTVAQAEDALGKHPVTPGALVPAREQLAELLLQLGRPAEALQAFEAALVIYPARFNGLYGAALAAERLGDHARARRLYASLAQQTARSTTPRPELARARAYLATEDVKAKAARAAAEFAGS